MGNILSASEGMSALVRPAQRTPRFHYDADSRGRREFSETGRRGGGGIGGKGWRGRGKKRSHRKSNTMVIRGESASVLLGKRGWEGGEGSYQSHPPSPTGKIRSNPIRQLPGIENLLNSLPPPSLLPPPPPPLSLSILASTHSPTLS